MYGVVGGINTVSHVAHMVVVQDRFNWTNTHTHTHALNHDDVQAYSH